MSISNHTVVLAPTLELAKTVAAKISIEAEYGDTVIPGSLYTAAHHGARAANPCPCVDPNIPPIEEGTILVSHIDLDTVGGVGRAIGHPAVDARSDAFWKAAAFIDTAGAHRIGEIVEPHGPEVPSLKDCLYAYWAWSQSNRGPQRSRDAVHDVTLEIEHHLNVVLEILQESHGDSLLAAGDEFKAAGEKLNADSFVGHYPFLDLICRKSDAFVNHLYVDPNGEEAGGVLALNTKTGAITLSFSDKSDKRDACAVMQAVFGPDAGGHKGIAGTPRGAVFTEDDMRKVREFMG